MLIENYRCSDCGDILETSSIKPKVNNVGYLEEITIYLKPCGCQRVEVDIQFPVDGKTCKCSIRTGQPP